MADTINTTQDIGAGSPQTDSGYAAIAKSNPTIPATSLNTTVSPVNISSAPPDTSAFTNALSLMNVGNTGNADNGMTNLLNLVNATESNAPTNPANTLNALNTQYGITDKTTNVNNLTAKLNAITSNATAAKTSLDSQAAGKDITTAFLGKQQQEIDRQALIQATPIKMQLDMAQGDLASAQNTVNTLYNAETKYQADLYNWKQGIIDKISQYADKQQQAALEIKKTQLQNDFTANQNELNRQNQITLKNLENQNKNQGDPNSTGNLAQQLVNGLMAPSELSKRTTNYNGVLAAADAYSLQTTGKHFDIAKADRDYKFATNVQTLNTLNYLGSLVGYNGQTGNLDELQTMSGQLGNTKFPALNKIENWSKLQTGDPQIAAYYGVVTEVADQVAKILQGGGTGSGTSDQKLAQAQKLFSSSFTADQVKATITALKPLLVNRGKNMVGDNPYLSDYNDLGGTTKKTDTPSVTSNGVDLSKFHK